MQFLQVNPRNIAETNAQLTNKFCIGFEVVEKEIIPHLTANIDPQHTGVKLNGEYYAPENISASKYLLKKLPTINPDLYDTIVLPSKLDIDALCAIVLWTKASLLSGFENDPVHQEAFLELCDRVNAIDTMDCGIGNSGVEWNPDYHKQNLVREITPFNVLGAMCSDFRCDIDFKRDTMLRWLTLGDLPQKYVDQVTQEMNAQKQSRIDNIYGVTVVESHARGATGILYSHAPFGVAYNSEFPTKDGTVKKFTICEFTAGRYINLQGILDELNEIESGWGGNIRAGIIGSPFGGTTLSPDVVCEIVSRHVK